MLLAAPTPVLAQQRLTVEDAIREALENNTRILAARAGKEALDANAKSMRGRLGPSVHLSEELQYYDCDFGLTSFQLFQAGCVNPNNPMTPAIRKQLTNTFVVALDQPLSGLAVIGEEWRARKQQAEAADASRKTVEQTVREAVESGFLRFFEAKAAEEIARASQAQLADQIQLAKARIAAGVLTNADLLRVEVAAANARQQEIQAQVAEQNERANLLALVVHNAGDSQVELVEPQALLQAGESTGPDFASARRSAMEHRPELLQAEKLQSVANRQKKVGWLSLLPQVDFEAAYMRLDGNLFAPPNSEYVGLKATWALWEWGATYYQARAAAKQAEASAFQLEELRREVDVEVSQRLAQLRAAATAVDVARTAIASAEEAYRVTTVLVRAGSATTTDLLDSQQALTQARLNLVRARYEQAIAHVQLSRATGE